ncbi:MAG: hypothetical protein QCI82_10710 [Candidatus Thermoplasmatota archaeon]|nr:hypothetical protein [Candidatus Thermoplasmatota archaeon]
MTRGGPDLPLDLNEVQSRWAFMDLPDWKREWKVNAPRVCLAKLVLGKDIEEVNNYLLHALPMAGAGTDWILHRGDHDFSMVPLTVILYLFGEKDDILFPKTREHILGKLLVLSGTRGSLKTPGSLGLKGETENHILMMEGCRYLKGRWSILHKGDESSPGSIALERWLAGHLVEKAKKGLKEFNSQPYTGYTLTALLMLSSFGGTGVSKASRDLLDRTNLHYSYGSLLFRRYPPFNRRRDHAGDGYLDKDYHTVMMKVWASRGGIDVSDRMITSGAEHALMASVLPYDLPGEVLDVLMGPGKEALVMIGHGTNRSPEIYSRGRGHLISAGGCRCNFFSEEVIRPITVLFDDGKRHLDDVIHLGLPDRMLRRPNNTGVHHRFAVSAGPVHVPRSYKLLERDGDWSLYEHGRHRIAVHSGSDPGIVAIFPEGIASLHLKDIVGRNGDNRKLLERFHFPDTAEVRYDLKAHPGTYMIIDTSCRKHGRDIGKWPLTNIVHYRRC